jgi:hypothetical protein
MLLLAPGIRKAKVNELDLMFFDHLQDIGHRIYSKCWLDKLVRLAGEAARGGLDLPPPAPVGKRA